MHTQTHTTEFMLFQGLLRETPLSVRLDVCADAGRAQVRQTYKHTNKANSIRIIRNDENL